MNSAVAALLDRPIAAAFSSWRNPWDPVRIAALNVRDGIPLGVRTSRVWTSSFESDNIVPSERSVGRRNDIVVRVMTHWKENSGGQDEDRRDLTRRR